MDEDGVYGKPREDLIVKYTPLIRYIAERIAMRLPPSILKDELLSAGVVGLLDALDKFKQDMGIKFKTYAEHRIRGAMLDELRKMDWIPRSVRKEIQRIEEAILTLESRLRREPEDFEIAREMGVELEEYFEIIRRGAGVGLLSLDEMLSEGKSPGAMVQLSEERSPLEELKKEELKKVMAEAIRKLSEKEQMVISLYYYDELTLKEIAEVLGLTESRICQIHTKAILRLRARLRSFYSS
jgi:RNA polymerase sigma factor FliA